MLCTFTLKTGGALVIRSDDIRAIVDEPGGTSVTFVAGDTITSFEIEGTAIENASRIAQEELDMIGRVEAHRFETQKQLQNGYPVPPVKRGRQ
jgi:hypothetical protein